ncbi:hypothetical protein TNCV_4296731 [Trichonephila clavipes]|nr:hypothetical protein TNCV_4296731 [Trichonephila clavipes]
MALQLAVSLRIPKQTVHRSLTEIGLYAQHPVLCYLTASNRSCCGAENIDRRHYKDGGVFFSVKSQDSPDKVILFKSSSGQKGELAFHPSI